MADPIDLLLPRLEGVRKTGVSSWMAKCPAHQDKTPSLSVREASDGRVLIYCFGGCGATDVLLSLGLDLFDLFPPRQEITYGPPKARDRSIPRVSAAEALKILDQDAFFVWLVAEAIQQGGDTAEFQQQLGEAAARISTIRQLWEAMP